MNNLDTYPRLCLTQLHHCPPNISCISPTLDFVPSAPNTRTPAIHIDREHVLDGRHEGLARRQEVIRQPAHVEKRPLNIRLSS